MLPDAEPSELPLDKKPARKEWLRQKDREILKDLLTRLGHMHPAWTTYHQTIHHVKRTMIDWIA